MVRELAGTGATRLPHKVYELLMGEYAKFGLTVTKISRLWKDFTTHRDAGTLSRKMSFGAKRKGRSATNTKLTEDIARKLIEINDKNFGTLSNRKLAGKLHEAFEGLDAREETVRHQKHGVDYDAESIYAPVADHVSIRLVLILALIMNAYIHTLDITMAFLYGAMPSEFAVYVRPPRGVSFGDGLVCRLLKCCIPPVPAKPQNGPILPS